MGLAIAAALGLSNASAAGITYFTANGTGTLVYYNWNLTTNTFGFLFDYLDITPSCPGGSCVAASTPGGTPLGNFGFSIGGNYFLTNTGNGLPATLVGVSLYYEQLAPFPAGATGSIAMNNAIIGGPSLLGGTVTGLGIYGTITTHTATVEVDITNPTSQLISGLPSTVYLDVTGTTNVPIGITTLTGNPNLPVINNFTLDWTATLSNTSFLNSSGPSGVPEPSTAVLLASALAGIFFVRRRTRRPPIFADAPEAPTVTRA